MRNIGVGLCMMPIITAGTSALPRTLTVGGVQRQQRHAAAGLQRRDRRLRQPERLHGAQISADRGALIGADPSPRPASRDRGAAGAGAIRAAGRLPVPRPAGDHPDLRQRLLHRGYHADGRDGAGGVHAHGQAEERRAARSRGNVTGGRAPAPGRIRVTATRRSGLADEAGQPGHGHGATEDRHDERRDQRQPAGHPRLPAPGQPDTSGEDVTSSTRGRRAPRRAPR